MKNNINNKKQLDLEIKSLILKHLGITSKIKKNIKPENYSQWDSLKHLKIIFMIEKKFNISFNTDELIKMIDYKTICSVVSNKIKL